MQDYCQNIIKSLKFRVLFQIFQTFSSPNLLVIAGFPLLIAYIDEKKKSAPSKAVISSNLLTGLTLYRQHLLNHNANTFQFLLQYFFCKYYNHTCQSELQYTAPAYISYPYFSSAANYFSVILYFNCFCGNRGIDVFIQYSSANIFIESNNGKASLYLPLYLLL